ncbi:MAG: dienelactone hydrolase family protein [Alphaproteobacteria bacterium]|nr:dienelactone hydrolase family protein [Alphaproteobacteria bacterium]
MGATISLTAADGHSLSAYRADPTGKVKAGLVVIQEIFGVNPHMRRVADGFAAAGYLCIAPALFDRVERHVELGYDKAAIETGRAIRGKVVWDQVMLDVAAAQRAAAAAGKVGSVGYCWGGSVCWLAATRLRVAGAVCYYGGQIAPFATETPSCPVQMHFGEKDQGIPLSDVDAIRRAQPGIEINLYPADHGFNCDERGSYHADSARLARERTLAFFARHLA